MFFRASDDTRPGTGDVSWVELLPVKSDVYISVDNPRDLKALDLEKFLKRIYEKLRCKYYFFASLTRPSHF